jgi:hypothetical protein
MIMMEVAQWKAMRKQSVTLEHVEQDVEQHWLRLDNEK